jgi:predicted small secreted protein
MIKRLPFALLLAPLVLAGCANKDNDITAIGGSIGQEVKRTSCPAVGVPSEVGDVTLFNPPESRDSRAIDVVAVITDVVGHCDDGDDVGKHAKKDVASESPILPSTVTFRVDARRSDPHGARDVVLPYFAVVLHGGTAVASKSISRISVHFDDGKLTASADGQASATVNRAEATLPENIRNKLIRKRNADDADATVDPMSDPTVRAALAKASFEFLVGFQLTQEQLAYNATK